MLTGLLLILFVPPAHSQPTALDPDIASASIQELLNIEVTTVSRRPESARHVPAAVTVLTQDDIKRSGARSIPELLRLVPGVQVARVNGNKWAVSIRGFNSRASNKLLVLIDGRSIYNPLFSGTLWETKDFVLHDIARVEVVRGPGGSTWGSNAVNGVINIITKNAADTLGGVVTAGGGTEERQFTSARYGVQTSESSYLRVYGKRQERDEGYLDEGASDDSRQGLAGFRFDANGEVDSFSLQGSYNGGNSDGIQPTGDLDNRDAVVQGSWNRTFSATSNMLFTGSFARTDINSLPYTEDRGTSEFTLQHTFQPLERLQVTSGLQYRRTRDQVEKGSLLFLDPPRRDDAVLAAFSNARVIIIPAELELRVGARLEHNDYTDDELQPDLGASWAPTKADLFWGSVARAVRTPSRLESDFIFNSQTEGLPTIRGNPDLDAESSVSYQLGYRRTISSTLSLDFASFYTAYRDLIVFDQVALKNDGRGNNYGLEIAPTWQPYSGWKTTAGYSLLFQDLRLDSDSVAEAARTTDVIEGNSPQNQLFARTGFDLNPEWTFDFGLRYVDSLGTNSVPAYLVGDTRLAWRARTNLEFAIVGQNLFDSHHFEQRVAEASQVQQGVFGQVQWTF